MEPAALARRCRRLGLDPIVVTDHDTIAGALKVRELGRNVIVGEEIKTSEGEVLALFLQREVPAGLDPFATMTLIKEQGGLVCIEHPYDSRRSPLSEAVIDELASMIDLVEVYNGRADEEANTRARELAETLGVPAIAGSDAHSVAEVGSVFVETPPCSAAAGLLKALAEPRIVTRRRPLP